MVAEYSAEIARPSTQELRSELAAHLNQALLSFVVEDGRHYLTIPGHLPFRSDPVPAQATGTPFYEEATTLSLSYLIRRLAPAHFFDIGAGQGYFSRVAASYRGAAPQVDAFEMRPEEVARIRRFLADDRFASRIALHRVGVSDRDVDGALVWQARSLLFENHPARDDYEEAWWRRLKFWLRNDTTRGLTAASMDVVSIDGFVRRSGRSPDIIKIDVEGYEGRVLRGAMQTLREARPYVLLELHSDAKQRFGMRRHEIAQIVFDAGYDALFLTDHRNKSRCEVVACQPGHPLLRRQRTDLVLFAPR